MRAPLKTLCLATLLLPAAPAAEWSVARSARFEVYSQDGEPAARAALLWFEQLHAAVQQETGLNVGGRNPVRIIGFASDAEYSRYRPGPAADAFYVGSADRDCIVMPSLEEGSFPTAAHEYSHVIQHAMQRHLPPWLSEGLADLFSTLRIDKRGSRVGGEVAGRLDVLRRRSWLPLDRLLSMTEPVRGDRGQSEVFYAESWALTDMLSLSPFYRPHFGAVIAAVASGSSGAATLRSTYGKSLETIRRDLAAWTAGHKSKPVPLAPVEPDMGAVTVARVSAAAVQILMAQLLLSTNDLAGAESAYRDVSRESPENADVWAGLGAVAAARQQYDEARSLWKRALELGLADPAICFHYAELLDGDPARQDERRAALERAIQLQPDFDDARWVLALMHSNAARYEEALAQLQTMQEIPAARAYHYWYTMADVLAGLGRSQEAQAAAHRASEHAATNEERARAAQLAYIAQTHLAVRVARDAEGNPRMVTTRVPNDATDFNPFVEPADDLRHVQGLLKEIECGGTLRIVVDTGAERLRLTIADPQRVQMRNAPAEFVCGPQSGVPVIVDYAAKGSDGILRALEFR
ncbi:MAG TPA: tetratricopeptide repeat protein [Candidatus Sulfopaludibacter sp.]|jgi:tetratricopeptide (TPR) repeat protein|nr:tetratricopeptide repeat protein [Candidatus Sulfopaludibacter sp.]